MLRRWWCAVFHMQVGESVYTRNDEYAGIMWTCRSCKKKRIRVEWDFDEPYCPDGTSGKWLWSDPVYEKEDN